MSQDGGLDGVTSERFDRVTNVDSLFWLCKVAMPHMPPATANRARVLVVKLCRYYISFFGYCLSSTQTEGVGV
ncbi:MAG: hypothetical protein M3332_06785 [Actinomycetota bacterium]|nr:hypothetical protein [Actinomycetota bacterium]